VSQDIDVRSYFIENAHKFGQDKEVWNRVVEVLLKNGITYMWELCEKDKVCVGRLFRDKDEDLYNKCCKLVWRVMDEYYAADRKAELLAAGEVFVDAYFLEHAPKIKGVTNRAVLALRRGGIETMSALCACSLEELKRVRNLGAKSLELALLMRAKYAAE